MASKNSHDKPLRVFISYKWESEEHNEWVEMLARDLRRRRIDAYLDKWEVRLGDSFSAYMTSAISECDVFLFVMTPQAVQAVEDNTTSGGAVKFEIGIANARKIAGEEFRFIGVLRKGSKVITHLRDNRYIDFRANEDYLLSLSSLVQDLEGATDKPELPEKMDLRLIAETLSHRVWLGLPHGQFTLIEPTAIGLQKAFIGELMDLARERAAPRGYTFSIFTVEVPECDLSMFSWLEETGLAAAGSGSLKTEEVMDVSSSLGYRRIDAAKDLASAESGLNHRTVLVLRSSKKYNSDLHKWLSHLRSFLTHHRDLTTIFLAADIDYNFPEMASGWRSYVSQTIHP